MSGHRFACGLAVTLPNGVENDKMLAAARKKTVGHPLQIEQMGLAPKSLDIRRQQIVAAGLGAPVSIIA